MRRILSALLVTALCLGSAGTVSADHLVDARSLADRMAAVETQRGHDVRAVERVLATPRAAAVASALGTRVDTVTRALPTLGDRELRDLAQRASALRVDPVSGDISLNDTLVIFLLVAIVILVLTAVD